MNLSCFLLIALTIAVCVCSSGAEGEGEGCHWVFKCESVQSTEPYVCGRWSAKSEIVCPDEGLAADQIAPASAPTEENACVTTYRCCQLKIKKKFLTRPGRGRRRRNRGRRLKDRGLSWRKGAQCLKWCAVSSDHCETEELPTPYETPVEENDTGERVLHGSVSTDVVEEATEEQPEEETEPETEAEPEAEQEADPEPENEEETVEVEITFSPRFIINAPCNGNYKPDRYGTCRAIF